MGKRARSIARSETPPGGRLVVPISFRTSNRCRSTHDVPYTLRCILSDFHWGTKHQDKNGRTW